MGFCNFWYEKLSDLFFPKPSSDDDEQSSDIQSSSDTVSKNNSDESDSLDNTFIFSSSDNYSEEKNADLLNLFKEGVAQFFSNKMIIVDKDEIDSLKSIISELEETVTQQQKQIDSYNALDTSLLDEIKTYLTGSSFEITISDVRVVNSNNEEYSASSDFRDKKKYVSSDFSSLPAVYHFTRPSWFTPLKKEFNETNAKVKNAGKTSAVFHSSTSFWKKFFTDKKIKELPVEKKAEVVDNTRKNNLAKLLNDCTISNEERYIKYLLLTPGMPDDFLKIFTGAAHLGIDARILIEFFELSKEKFNYELVSNYLSELQKGNDFNLKKEFAKELIRGDWYITSENNGKTVKYQIVPQSEFQTLKKTLDMIFQYVNSNHTGLNIPEAAMTSAATSSPSSASSTETSNESSAEDTGSDTESTDDNSFDDYESSSSDVDYSTM